MLRRNGSHAMANIAALRCCSGTKLREGYYSLMNVPAHVPDKVDRAILAHLQRDGRIANVDLADAVGLSPSACLRRVKALEADGITIGSRGQGRTTPGRPWPDGVRRAQGRQTLPRDVLTGRGSPAGDSRRGWLLPRFRGRRLPHRG